MTLGKHQRTEHYDFLGNEYILEVCKECSVVYETMSIDTGPKICPGCSNKTLEEHLEENMDYSKSFDECFRDQAKLVREWNDKGKHK